MLQQRSTYVSPVHRLERVRIRARTSRSRTDFAVLYALAAIGGMASGFALSVLI